MIFTMMRIGNVVIHELRGCCVNHKAVFGLARDALFSLSRLELRFG